MSNDYAFPPLAPSPSSDPPARERLPSFLYSAASGSAGPGPGTFGGASGEPPFSYGRTIGGGNISDAQQQQQQQQQNHVTFDETTTGKTWPFQGRRSGGGHVNKTSSIGITFNDRLRHDTPMSEMEPNSTTTPSTLLSPPSTSTIPSNTNNNPSTSLRTPSRLPPNRSLLDSSTPSVLQLRPMTPGSFARGTPRNYDQQHQHTHSPTPLHHQSPSVTNNNNSRWITIFGFTSDMESQALREFRRHGDLVRTVPGKGNWIHLLYRTPLQAQVALYRPWRILAGSDTMVGAVPCTEPDMARHEDDVVERGFLVASPTVSHRQQIDSADGGDAATMQQQQQQQVPKTPAKSPLRSPADMLRRGNVINQTQQNQSQREAAAQSIVQTPQKQVGFLDYLTGFYK